MRKMVFLLLSLAFISPGCADHTIEREICYEGIVIGKIRSWGGGIAVSMKEPTFSTHQWRGYEHVIEALNISDGLHHTGEKIYFTARMATNEEQIFPMSADGDESDKSIVFVLDVSSITCPIYDD
jgi:hypothetical protein